MGETDVLIYSLFPMEIKAVNNKNPNQTAEFSKTALLDKAQKLQGYDFVDNNNEILNLKRQSTILFYVQILLIFCVIIINSLSFTVFKK
jgi:ABC-type lipoprotein release transport system permease subunit